MSTLSDRLVSRLFERIWRGASPALRRDLATTVTRGFERLTYERLRENGLYPDGVIDVGANRGDWSRMVRRIFPAPRILMIEAQEALEPMLAQTAIEIGRAQHRIALLGPVGGEKRAFFEMGTGSSLLAENSNIVRAETVLRTQTLDEVAETALPMAQSLFVKLDVQGAELLVLAGGKATLDRSAAVQLEVALLHYNTGAPLLDEVIEFMGRRAFHTTEIAGFSRPRDHLVQVDIIFTRAGSPLRPEYFTF